MATRTWISTGSTDFNDPSNWSGSGALLPSDDLVFNSTSTINAYLTSSGAVVNNFSLLVGYDGIFDCSNLNLNCNGDLTIQSGTTNFGNGTHSIGGNVQFNAPCTINLNTSQWVVQGGWYSQNSSGLVMSFTSGNHTEFTGSGNVNFNYNQRMGDITISGTYTSNGVYHGNLIVSGSLNITNSAWTATSVINTGIITGAGLLTTGNITFTTGTWNVANTNISYASRTISPNTYTTNFIFYKGWSSSPVSKVFSAGDYVFDGNVTFYGNHAQVYNIDLSTNNPNITITGDLIINENLATMVWLHGTEPTIFNGTSDQDIVLGCDVSNVSFDKPTAGSITLEGDGDINLGGDSTCQDLTLSSIYTGAFDAGIYDIFLKDLTIANSGILDLGSGTWTFSGNIDFSAFAGTLDYGTSSIVMDGGTSETPLTISMLPITSIDVYAFAVSLGSYVDSSETGTYLRVRGEAFINGSLEMNIMWTYKDITIGSSGSISGYMVYMQSETQLHGTINPTSLSLTTMLCYNCKEMPTGDYTGVSGSLRFSNYSSSSHVQTLASGSVFNYVSIQVNALGDKTLSGDFDVIGDLSDAQVSTGIPFFVGNATLTGPADQDIALDQTDLSNATFIINKTSGTSSFLNDISCRLLNITDPGTLVNFGSNTFDIYNGWFGAEGNPNVDYSSALVHVLGPQIWPPEPRGGQTDGSALEYIIPRNGGVSISGIAQVDFNDMILTNGGCELSGTSHDYMSTSGCVEYVCRIGEDQKCVPLMLVRSNPSVIFKKPSSTAYVAGIIICRLENQYVVEVEEFELIENNVVALSLPAQEKTTEVFYEPLISPFTPDMFLALEENRKSSKKKRLVIKGNNIDPTLEKNIRVKLASMKHGPKCVKCRR